MGISSGLLMTDKVTPAMRYQEWAGNDGWQRRKPSSAGDRIRGRAGGAIARSEVPTFDGSRRRKCPSGAIVSTDDMGASWTVSVAEVYGPTAVRPVELRVFHLLSIYNARHPINFQFPLPSARFQLCFDRGAVPASISCDRTSPLVGGHLSTAAVCECRFDASTL